MFDSETSPLVMRLQEHTNESIMAQSSKRTKYLYVEGVTDVRLFDELTNLQAVNIQSLEGKKNCTQHAVELRKAIDRKQISQDRVDRLVRIVVDADESVLTPDTDTELPGVLILTEYRDLLAEVVAANKEVIRELCKFIAPECVQKADYAALHDAIWRICQLMAWCWAHAITEYPARRKNVQIDGIVQALAEDRHQEFLVAAWEQVGVSIPSNVACGEAPAPCGDRAIGGHDLEAVLSDWSRDNNRKALGKSQGSNMLILKLSKQADTEGYRPSRTLETIQSWADS